jgi:DNA polymerase-1
MRALSKLKSTYLEMKLDQDSRFRCSFNPVGTVNSRLSSSKNFFGTGGNAQNLPKAFRKFMVADPGYVMYQFDLGQAENRVVAYISPEPTMIKAFEDRVDMHRLTASMIFGVPLDQVTDEQRQWGKRANHGLNYDLGFKKFAFLYEIPEADAKYIVDRYHITYPGIRQFHAWVQHKLRQDRTLVNLFGRARRFTDRWGQELFKAAYDYIPQSTVATKLNRDGVLELYQKQDLYPEVELLNQVHDSVVFQLPIAAGFLRHAEILTHLKQALESPLKWRSTSFSIPADLKMGLNFGVMEDVPADEFQSLERLDRYLSSLYAKLGASNAIPQMDSYLDDSLGDAEEVSAEVGDAEFLP